MMAPMTNSIQIQFTLEAVSNFDRIAAGLKAADFPVISTDRENSAMVVDATVDFNEYSVLMATEVVLEELRMDGDEAIYAKKI